MQKLADVLSKSEKKKQFRPVRVYVAEHRNVHSCLQTVHSLTGYLNSFSPNIFLPFYRNSSCYVFRLLLSPFLLRGWHITVYLSFVSDFLFRLLLHPCNLGTLCENYPNDVVMLAEQMIFPNAKWHLKLRLTSFKYFVRITQSVSCYFLVIRL